MQNASHREVGVPRQEGVPQHIFGDAVPFSSPVVDKEGASIEPSFNPALGPRSGSVRYRDRPRRPNGEVNSPPRLG